MQVIPPSAQYAAPSIADAWGSCDGETVYVVGYGTSLRGFDWTRLAGRTTIAVNNAVFAFAPTYHLYSDKGIRGRYWKPNAAAGWTGYAPETTIVVLEDVAREAREIRWPHLPQVRTFQRVSDNIRDIPRNNDQLYVERTVATAGVMMAWKLGAARVYLLGVDGYCLVERTADGRPVYYADGSGHATFDAPRDQDSVQGEILVRECHREWAGDCERLRDYFACQSRGWERGVPQIFIASPRSTIGAWPKVTIEEALA